jgi:hypothetical protein
MADKEPMGVAAYLLAYTLVRKLQAKGLISSIDAEDLISRALRQLGPSQPADTELEEARTILAGTLEHVQEEAPDEPWADAQGPDLTEASVGSLSQARVSAAKREH